MATCNEALIVVDMTNDFVDNKGSLTVGKAAQDIVPYIIKQADEMLVKGGRVIFVNDAHSLDEEQFTSGQWPVHCIKETWGAILYEPLEEWYAENHDKNVSEYGKSHYDAFDAPLVNYSLMSNHPEDDVKIVHLCGVCTDICIFATALGAYAKGYKVIVHRNGCATFTNNHELFLKHMELCVKAEIR